MPARAIRYILAVAILLNVLSMGFAEEAMAADENGRDTINQLAKLFSTWSGRESPAVFKAAAALIDYNEMSELALGAHWRKLKASEQRDFVKWFQCLVQERYYKRWHKIFSRGKLSFVAEIPDGDELHVKTRLSAGRKSEILVWRLSKRSGQYKVISLSADDKDLLKRLSRRVQSHLQKDGFNKLIAWMKDESDMDEGED